MSKSPTAHRRNLTAELGNEIVNFGGAWRTRLEVYQALKRQHAPLAMADLFAFGTRSLPVTAQPFCQIPLGSEFWCDYPANATDSVTVCFVKTDLNEGERRFPSGEILRLDISSETLVKVPA